jgi:hypothetical protein
MGVAPEAMAEIFGYRLKKIDKYIFLYFFVHQLSISFTYAMYSFFRMSQAPESKMG